MWVKHKWVSFTHTLLLVCSPFSLGCTLTLHQVFTLFTLTLCLHYSGCTQTLLWVLHKPYSTFTSTLLRVYSHFFLDCVGLTIDPRFTQLTLQPYTHFTQGLLTLFSGFNWNPTPAVYALSSRPTHFSLGVSHTLLWVYSYFTPCLLTVFYLFYSHFAPGLHSLYSRFNLTLLWGDSHLPLGFTHTLLHVY